MAAERRSIGDRGNYWSTAGRHGRKQSVDRQLVRKRRHEYSSIRYRGRDKFGKKAERIAAIDHVAIPQLCQGLRVKGMQRSRGRTHAVIASGEPDDRRVQLASI